MPEPRPEDFVAAIIGKPLEAMDARTQRVARHVAQRRHISRAPGHADELPATLGQRAADRVAAFGGSWTFVGLFVVAMVAWVALNAVLLARQGQTFDPYPFILLNLFLSMLAAIQAPVILMAQNRQAERDRASAGHDYEVNLKAELEIMLLHDKLDQLRRTQWDELLAIQREQVRLLADLRHNVQPSAAPPSAAA